ncbi:MAG: 2-phosphosulfolactate phosphatase [Betaproteobacteria bacterium]|nr:2-phosphosulfolactate phosphatase [Betaproteobacteria bacterium]MDH5220348.1 2-phosphosulfolactate phosphatase [Betaproteobacteria bacterium]MDH5349791.1 2-phosphosulfolactate phosphatase [Betaproteobacteria bacterium]
MSARIELNHRIHVLTRKEELDEVRVPGKIVVVLDILFATTTMVAALGHGAAEVLPVADESAARAAGARHAPDSYVLSGELYAETLPGFAHPAPLALVAHGVRDKTVIYSTTNGTVAMTLAAGAKRVYCGALLNARAVAERIVAEHPRDTVLILCSGSGGNFNLEDFYGAGCFVDRFAQLLGSGADFSDAARAALAFYRASAVPQVLRDCRVGRMMVERGLGHEVEFAARFDALPIVPALEQGRVKCV